MNKWQKQCEEGARGEGGMVKEGEEIRVVVLTSNDRGQLPTWVNVIEAGDEGGSQGVAECC